MSGFLVLGFCFFSTCSLVLFFFAGMHLDDKRKFICASFVFGGLLCVGLTGFFGWRLFLS